MVLIRLVFLAAVVAVAFWLPVWVTALLLVAAGVLVLLCTVL